MKTALITGITGQDGSFLAELLLQKGYQVYGLIRNTSNENLKNCNHLTNYINIIYGDMIDSVSIINAVKSVQPDEIYNLAAQSFVGISWAKPIETANVNAIGVASLLEAIRISKPDCKFFQASSCNMYGAVQETPQDEKTPFYPINPYGTSKLYGHWITKNYRESYNIFACCGILFNHESERRGLNFVTRKIANQAAKIKLGLQASMELGNIEAIRDWGYAKDYVNAMWMMLQQEKPDDYVIATGEAHTVKEFIELAFKLINIDITWLDVGINEKGIDKKTSKTLVTINPNYFRPTESDILVGDPKKIIERLGWKREVYFEQLVEIMVKKELSNM